jgi:hypothetical protein
MKRDGINPGGTHFPILAAALERTGASPVVELGIGDYSTPLLHFLCARTKRPLLSIDHHAEWLEGFSKIYQDLPWHEFRRCDWANVPGTFNGMPIGVAFIDLAPGDMRPVMARRLADMATFIVCHDTEAYGDGWASLRGVFKYETIWKEYPTWTTVYSNLEEFKL